MFVRRAFRSRKVYCFRRRYPRVFAFSFFSFMLSAQERMENGQGRKSHTHLAVDEKTGLHREKALFDVSAAAIASTILRLDGHTILYQHNTTTPPTLPPSYFVYCLPLPPIDQNNNITKSDSSPFLPCTAVVSHPDLLERLD